ncbi:hypothetical protein OOK60_12555 [Trichothermofontia sichuanensis B231]|uniref:hypothetical protein n=1 Tax=Trichothermofontia sichuanensis TaxID=3045816 RepID=UPI0022474FAB|nr:hypothetical protein [Trichothermofontia sichuanensis]UZQ53332.1 hypothetical protein OOK60_12555 [Trichothermofontia sichuanensis B231]
MSYSEFTIAKVQELFHLAIAEQEALFTDVQPVEPSELLQMILKEYLSLAIDVNSEKVRSEFIIAPVLGDVRRQSGYQISLFSGKEFDVDRERGLSGYCDFILCLSKEQLYIQAPVVMIVEAKNENIVGGMGQCMASMVAAQIFNQQTSKPIDEIYGAVTTGTNWRFLKLIDQTLWIDKTEYYIRDVDKILGILMLPTTHLLKPVQ